MYKACDTIYSFTYNYYTIELILILHVWFCTVAIVLYNTKDTTWLIPQQSYFYDLKLIPFSDFTVPFIDSM